MMHCDFATYSKVGLERTRLWWQLLLAFCEYNSVGPLHKKADQVTSASASSIMCKSGYFCLHMRASSKAKNCQGFKHKCGFWKIQLLKSSWQKMSKSRCLQRKETKHIWKKKSFSQLEESQSITRRLQVILIIFLFIFQGEYFCFLSVFLTHWELILMWYITYFFHSCIRTYTHVDLKTDVLRSS